MNRSQRTKPAVEVTEKATRRQDSAAYKLSILQEADACTKRARWERCYAVDLYSASHR
jgi:hypothetical protein